MKVSKTMIFFGLMVFGVITTWQYTSQNSYLEIDTELDQMVRDNMNDMTEEDMIAELSNDLQFDTFVYRITQNDQNVNDFKTDTDTTFLQTAVRLNNFRQTQILLRMGANVNAQNDSGWTALHFAIANGQNCTLEMVQLLIQAGADLTLKNSAGFNSIDLALMSKYLSPSVKGYLVSLFTPEETSPVVRGINFRTKFRPINRDNRSFINEPSVAPIAIKQAVPGTNEYVYDAAGNYVGSVDGTYNLQGEQSSFYQLS